jgi:hypothetical protein
MAYGASGRQKNQVALQPLDQNGPTGVATFGTKTAVAMALEIGCVDAIGIDQTAKNETYQQAKLLLSTHRATLLFSGVGAPDLSQQLLKPGDKTLASQQLHAALQQLRVSQALHLFEMGLLQGLMHTPIEDVLTKGVSPGSDAIDQTRMMRGNAKRYHLANYLLRQSTLTERPPCELCPGGGVIHLALEALGIDPVLVLILIQHSDGRFQIGLKRVAELAKVVQQSQQFAHVLQAQLACELGGESTDACQVITERLPCVV